jgi:hypothetical protein
MGRTGKSVARSYMASLDSLIPVEASISGTIALNKDKVLEPRAQIIRDRYVNAMNFLKSPDDLNRSRSKLSTYVEKQDSWNKTVEAYSIAQERQQGIIKNEGLKIDDQRQAYLEWVQAHARDYKAAIQARYMDWVVHGYKFEIEFNFGIVDISSGMKRVESSKEAFRNLVLIAADGATEYSGVNLSPQNWATHVKNKYESWGRENKGPSPIEIRSEIRRLRKLLISHQAMESSVADGSFFAHVAIDQSTSADEELKTAYSNAYEAVDGVNKERMDTAPLVKAPLAGAASGDEDEKVKENEEVKEETGSSAPKPNQSTVAAGTEPSAKEKQAIATANAEFGKLRKAQDKWSAASLATNKKANRDNSDTAKAETKKYLDGQIEALKKEIDDLEGKLAVMTKKSSKVITPAVLDADGKTIDPQEMKTDPDLFREPSDEKPSPWTRITAKVSQSQSESTKVTKESASSFAARVSTGLWSASSGASHTSASAKAMSSMSGLDVEISMDCMLVEIQRPWLHAELFSDHELDVAESYPLSPGPEKLHEYVRANKPVPAKYAEFCSYPTAFVVASNVELEFSGNTSSLESALESSSTEANLSVGYGPFSVSGSHKQAKSKSKTKAESTATGMRISLQAPQIIAWVQELLPELPKPKDASNKLFGLSLVSS